MKKNEFRISFFLKIFALAATLSFIVSCSDIGESITNDVTTSYTVYMDNPEDEVSPRSVTLSLRVGDYLTGGQLISLCSSSLVKTGYRIKALRYWSNPYESTSLATAVPFYISTNSDGDIQSVQVYPDAATLYVYGWEKIDYTVRFNGNGGKTSFGDTYYSQSGFKYDDGTKTLDSNLFARNGYTFIKWNSKADGSGTPYLNNASVENLATTQNAIVNLYAQWEANGCVSEIDDGLSYTENTATKILSFTASGSGFWIINGELKTTSATSSYSFDYTALTSGTTYTLYFVQGSSCLTAIFTIP